MNLKKSDDAISPVIGVMLMLVITVVIAAVITVFATGTVADTEPAPTAVLDVEIFDYYQALDSSGGPDFHITHIAGDAVDTKDLEIRLSWENNGKSYFSTYSADSFKSQHSTGVDGGGGDIRWQPMYVKTPLTHDMIDEGEFGTEKGASKVNPMDYYFGDAVLKSGMCLTATADFLIDNKKNTRSLYMDIIFNNGKTDGLDSEYGIMKVMPEGTAVNVMILHVPSNKAIFDKVVYVK